VAATLAQVREAEAALAVTALVQAAVAATEQERFEFPPGAVAASETT
jgi:hypothetical protein